MPVTSIVIVSIRAIHTETGQGRGQREAKWIDQQPDTLIADAEIHLRT